MATDNSGLIAAALLKTNPKLYEQIDGGNSWKTAVRMRGARVDKYRDYERGNHDSALTTQMRKMLRLNAEAEANTGLTDFNANYCRIVIDKMASRILVSEVTADDGGPIDLYIQELFDRNDFPSLEGQFFRAAVRDGDSYAMVDPTTLRWVSEPAYDGFSGMVAIFGNGGDYPIWACKIWSVGESHDLLDDSDTVTTMRLNTYQPSAIRSWEGTMNSGDLTPIALDLGNGFANSDNSIPWSLPIVPVIHFGNLTDNYTHYGESELRVVIPIQNVMNRTLHSMVMASEFAAFKLAYSIGMKFDKSGITPGSVLNFTLQDENGNDIINLTSEQIEFLKSIKVGEFSATDLSQYTVQLQELTKHASQASQTPIYGITTQGNISGEALKQLEIGLIGKILRFQRENNSAIRLLIELTAKIQNAFDTSFGDAPKLEGKIHITWVSPEILDVATTVASMLDIRERAPGLFTDDFIRQRIGGLLGLTQSQIVKEGAGAPADAKMQLEVVQPAKAPTNSNLTKAPLT
jgi:hypothetical protein